jgi:iron complex outermembrane receptor protein
MYTRMFILLAGLMYASLTLAVHEPLEEIIVTADPLSRVDSKLSQAVDVISAEDLRNKAMRNIGEAISDQLGVSTADFGPSVGQPVIRGLSGSRVRVLENDIGTMDASTVGPDHAVSTEPIFAGQIEIFRGPATLLYGSGASGGLINVASDRIPDHPQPQTSGDLYLDYDTASNGVMGAGRLNSGFGNIALHLDGMARDTGNHSIPGYAALDPEPGAEKGTLENSYNRTHNVSLGTSYVSENGYLGGAISNYHSKYGLPPVGDEEGENIDLNQNRYHIAAELENPLPGFAHAKTSWVYNNYRHNVVDAAGAVGTRLHNQGVEGRVELIHNPLANWNGVVGLQYRYRDFSAAGEEITPAIKQDSVAIFGLEKGTFGDWHVDAGLRYETTTAKQSGVTQDHNASSISGGLNRDYQDGYNIGMNATHSQRSPDIEELFGGEPAHVDEGVFIVSDPALNNETSTNLDLSWKKTSGPLTLTANLYYNWINDFIYLGQNDLNHDGQADKVEVDYDGDPANILATGDEGGLFLVSQTQGKARFRGTELESVYTFLDEGNEHASLRLWTDYVRASLKDGTNLPRITPWRFGGDINYGKGPWQASLDYTRVARQNEIAPLETSTDGYNQLNFYAGRKISYNKAEFIVFVRGTNLLNEEIRRNTSFLKAYSSLPGRAGELGIRATF